MPSHDYEYFEHAAVGRDLREYHVGFNIARRLDPILPRAFLQAQYSYAFVERVLNIAPNRSNVDAQTGYFLTPRLTLLGSTQWIHTYDGVKVNFNLPQAGLSGEQWIHHDQISRSTLLDVGGGVSFAVNRKMEMFVSFARSVEGPNGHLHGALVTIGVSRTFSTKVAAENAPTATLGDWDACAESGNRLHVFTQVIPSLAPRTRREVTPRLSAGIFRRRLTGAGSGSRS
jgi:hypothetical protein